MSTQAENKSRNDSTSKTKDSTSYLHSIYMDILFAVSLFLASFFFLALFTYSPHDSVFNSFSDPQPAIENWGGFYGAFISSFCFYYLGLTAFFIPVLWLEFPIQFIFRKNSAPSIFTLLSGNFFLWLASLFLLSFFLPHFSWQGLELESLGQLGNELTHFTRRQMGGFGTFILAFTSFFLGLTLITQKPMISKSIRSLKNSLAHILFKAQSKILQTYNRIKKSLPLSLNKQKMSQPSQMDTPTDPILIHYDSKPISHNHSHQYADIFKQSSVVFDPEADHEQANISQTIEKTLLAFTVYGKIVGVQKGPSITVFEFEPSAGTKQTKILGLADDLALALKVHAIMIQPVINKRALGIQVPNKKRDEVLLGDLLNTPNFQNFPSYLPFALGKSITGEVLCEDITTMPHLLIAGTTGSGKSVGVNSLICGILVKSSPKKVKLLLIDPKMLELSIYNGIPHLLMPVVTSIDEATKALQWAEAEMDNRYKMMEQVQVRNILAFNHLKAEAEQLPYILIVIDELADLMLNKSKEFETIVQRLAQKSRASGIHLVLATQRPSVDVVTGVIKANFPTRISFQVASRHDSRTILDQIGAEKLLGKGDLLYMKPGLSKIIRAQSPFVSDGEIHSLVLTLKNKPNYSLTI